MPAWSTRPRQRGVLGPLSTLATGLLLVAAAQSQEREPHVVDDPVYTAPAQLVKVEEGRRINLFCTGVGSPTVLLEAGLGDSTRTWALVQPEIARHTRTCSYDRAGLGFSDPSRRPGTAANAVDDLAKLVRSADLRPPYLLVGHSYGGMIARLFASRHLPAVVGLVLVDPSHEDVGLALFALDPDSLARNRKYLDDLGRCLDASDWQFSEDRELNALCVDQPDPHYSSRLNSAARLRAAQGTQVRAWISEMTNVWRASADEVRAERISLGSVPLVILTKEPAQPSPGESTEMRERKNRLLSGQFDDTARLSSRGKRAVVRGSGHYIQFDQPTAVIDAILQVLEDGERAASSPP